MTQAAVVGRRKPLSSRYGLFQHHGALRTPDNAEIERSYTSLFLIAEAMPCADCPDIPMAQGGARWGVCSEKGRG
jgi:hypothetical protein